MSLLLSFLRSRRVPFKSASVSGIVDVRVVAEVLAARLFSLAADAETCSDGARTVGAVTRGPWAC